MQISDSHIGFHLPPNPDPTATLTEAIDKIRAMPTQPAFLIHTGDISHLSKEEEWDTADQIIKSANKQVFFIPGEHDVADADNGKAYLERYGKSTKGKGWYSFDIAGVHFIGLMNVFDFQPRYALRHCQQGHARGASTVVVPRFAGVILSGRAAWIASPPTGTMASGRRAAIFDAKSASCEQSPARSSPNQIFAFSKPSLANSRNARCAICGE